MVALHSFAGEGRDTAAVLRELEAGLRASGLRPAFAWLFYGCSHDDAALADFVRRCLPDTAVLGGTSCSGLLTDKGLRGPDGIGLLVLEDPDGDYGVAGGELGEDAGADAARLLRDALRAADCPEELPELVWIYQAPGREEDVIAGLRSVVGDRCPIVGGSSADDQVAGRWRQLSSAGITRRGLAVGVLFPSGGVACAFQGGYEPTGAQGTVTRVGFTPTGGSGTVTAGRGRRILQIDGEPAARVYDRWLEGRIAGKLQSGGTILADTTTSPLGIEAGDIDGVSQFLLVHPERVEPDGTLTTFATVDQGATVYCMRGDKQRLVERAGRVAAAAAAGLDGGAEALAGGLLVYCGGCMMAVDDRMPEVVSEVADSFRGQPFIGCFTFGEQGRLFDRNVHGNLMISAIAFGR